MVQEQAEPLRGALLGAPVPAGSSLRRPDAQGGSACALVRHTFASLGPKIAVLSHCSSLRADWWPQCQVKGKEAGQQTSCVAWMQIVRLWATANRKSSLRGHRSRTATDLAKRKNRSYRVSCYRRLSSRIVPFDDLYPNQPRLQKNLPFRTDWLHLRGIAGAESAILPIREIAAYLWCSA